MKDEKKMNDFDEYEFKFDAYTPETIPMERLAKYLDVLAKLFGHTSSVHFDRVESGSTKPIMRVEKEDAPKVAHRIADINRGAAANDAMASFDELNELLRTDNAAGWLNRRPADSQVITLVLSFAGKGLPRPVRFGPFTEPASIDGELVKIGGKDKSAHATIIDPEGRAWSGEMTRELAQEIAPHLYKGPKLRVTGEAKWERLENSAWHLISLKISGFDILPEDTLNDATKRLRDLRNTDWDKVGDIDTFINAERGESDGLH